MKTTKLYYGRSKVAPNDKEFYFSESPMNGRIDINALNSSHGFVDFNHLAVVGRSPGQGAKPNQSNAPSRDVTRLEVAES